MNKRIGKLAVLIVALLVGVGLVWAEQKSAPAASAPEPTMYMMMNGGGHWNMHATIARLDKTITQARESSDPRTGQGGAQPSASELANLRQMVTCLTGGGQGMMMAPSGMHGWMMGQNGQAMPMNRMYGNTNPPAAR